MDTPLSGLSSAEAARRLAADGPNALPAKGPRRTLAIVRDVLREPMFLLLVLAAGLYLALGDPAEGALLAGFAGLSVGLVVLQERRGERALAALADLSAPIARVVRDGTEREIPSRDLVVGDLIRIVEGERPPADAIVRQTGVLSADESLLTGESAPVVKAAAPVGFDFASAVPGGDGSPALYAGTLVVQGSCEAEVAATGPRTQAGRIGASLAAIGEPPSPLQRSIGRLVRLFGLLAAAALAGLVLYAGLTRGAWLEGLLSGIALAMALLPEEFPMVLAIFTALGAHRLARSQVLARRAMIVETLGAASVLCVDKTGTLTENRMQVAALHADGSEWRSSPDADLPERLHRLLEFALLASQPGSADPMDRAVTEAALSLLGGTEHVHPKWALAREYPLTAKLFAKSQVWSHDGGYSVAAKGAPEAIAGLCHLGPEAHASLMRDVAGLAGQGLRVLAVAEGLAPHKAAREPGLPPDQHDFGFRLLGLVAFEDPVRSSVPDAIAAARAAGIRVVMLTGDYPKTARAIGVQAGLDVEGPLLTGDELDALDDESLAREAVRVSIFARIRPEQKLRIVRALQAHGAAVAMTGDGVNDAPALKAADVGVAVGRGATDVAKEAADVVLLDPDFGRLIEAVRHGRRIFDNLRKAMLYIMAIHVPIAGLALLPVLMGLPPLLLPAHVVLTEMVIDPACSLAFEGLREEKHLMRRKPRDPKRALVGAPEFALAMVQGAILLAAVLALYVLALGDGVAEGAARAQAFVALTAGNVALVRVEASHGFSLARLLEPGHRVFWLIAAAAAAIVAATLLIPPLTAIMQFETIGSASVAVAMGVGLAAAVLGDGVKAALRKS
jgi:P-type Ca2+ transporter type 2C